MPTRIFLPSSYFLNILIWNYAKNMENIMKATNYHQHIELNHPVSFISVNKLQVVIKDNLGFKNKTFSCEKDARQFAKSIQLSMLC